MKGTVNGLPRDDFSSSAGKSRQINVPKRIRPWISIDLLPGMEVSKTFPPGVDMHTDRGEYNDATEHTQVNKPK